MATDRKMTEQRAAEKPAIAEQPRAASPSGDGASPARIGFSQDETPPVRLNDGPVGAGQSNGRVIPPVPTLPTRTSAVPPSPRPSASSDPAFTVTASITGTSGPNAVLTPEAE